MYMDSYVISSLVIVALTCVVIGYLGYYGWRHIKQDMDKTEKKK